MKDDNYIDYFLVILLAAALSMMFAYGLSTAEAIELEVYKTTGRRSLRKVRKSIRPCLNLWNSSFPPEVHLHLKAVHKRRLRRKYPKGDFHEIYRETFYFMLGNPAFDFNTIYVFTYPALRGEGKRWYAGLGAIGHYRSNRHHVPAFVTIHGKRPISKIAPLICHELGHLFGFTHDDGGVMSGQGFWFSTVSKARMQKSIREWEKGSYSRWYRS